MKETHEILTTPLSEQQKKDFASAYTLLTWHEYPDTARLTPMKVLLQNLTFGWLGAGGGKTREIDNLAKALRQALETQ